MGQFDSFTQSVGDSFVGLIGSVGRNIVCPVGCAVSVSYTHLDVYKRQHDSIR